MRGDRTQGAPNLTDEEWLYGGDVATLRRTIFGPRNGVMPAWTDRLDPATVRALAIYVHALGGGE
jgi:cytochrome c oxidase cbb3-type subunit 3